MLIRRERAVDTTAVAAVHRSAFAAVHDGAETAQHTALDALHRGAFDANPLTDPDTDGNPIAEAGKPEDPPEIGLLERLRTDPGWIPTLSIVATEHDAIVGHVCLTRATVGPFPVLALGPLGVRNDLQHRGIGAALMHAAVGAADALDEPLIGLLGSLHYYPRFGFAPGTRHGILPDEPSWASHFQIRTLTAYDPQIAGDFHYAEPFYS